MRPFDAKLEQRQRRQVERVHAMGPPTVLHLLRDVERSGDLNATLEEYARLDPSFIRGFGADRFVHPLMLVLGDPA